LCVWTKKEKKKWGFGKRTLWEKGGGQNRQKGKERWPNPWEARVNPRAPKGTTGTVKKEKGEKKKGGLGNHRQKVGKRDGGWERKKTKKKGIWASKKKRIFWGKTKGNTKRNTTGRKTKTEQERQKLWGNVRGGKKSQQTKVSYYPVRGGAWVLKEGKKKKEFEPP